MLISFQDILIFLIANTKICCSPLYIPSQRQKNIQSYAKENTGKMQQQELTYIGKTGGSSREIGDHSEKKKISQELHATLPTELHAHVTCDRKLYLKVSSLDGF